MGSSVLVARLRKRMHDSNDSEWDCH